MPPGSTRSSDVGACVWVPTTQLTPDYGLVTSTVGTDGVTTQTGYANPELGLATSTTVDPGGLKLIDGYSYETAGPRNFDYCLHQINPPTLSPLLIGVVIQIHATDATKSLP